VRCPPPCAPPPPALMPHASAAARSPTPSSFSRPPNPSPFQSSRRLHRPCSRQNHQAPLPHPIHPPPVRFVCTSCLLPVACCLCSLRLTVRSPLRIQHCCCGWHLDSSKKSRSVLAAVHPLRSFDVHRAAGVQSAHENSNSARPHLHAGRNHSTILGIFSRPPALSRNFHYFSAVRRWAATPSSCNRSHNC
jgi:hypothetical protein